MPEEHEGKPCLWCGQPATGQTYGFTHCDAHAKDEDWDPEEGETLVINHFLGWEGDEEAKP